MGECSQCHAQYFFPVQMNHGCRVPGMCWSCAITNLVKGQPTTCYFCRQALSTMESRFLKLLKQNSNPDQYVRDVPQPPYLHVCAHCAAPKLQVVQMRHGCGIGGLCWSCFVEGFLKQPKASCSYCHQLLPNVEIALYCRLCHMYQGQVTSPSPTPLTPSHPP